MNTQGFARTARPKVAAALLALGALTFSLTGCGGNDGPTGQAASSDSIDGQYYIEKGNDLGRLTVEGNTLTYSNVGCSETENKAIVKDKISAEGTISDDGTTVVWTSNKPNLANKSVDDTTPIKINKADGKVATIDIDGDRFVFKPVADPAAFIAQYDHMCQGARPTNK